MHAFIRLKEKQHGNRIWFASFNADNRRDVSVDFQDLGVERTSFLTMFKQRFQIESPHIDMLHRDEYWSTFVPNPVSGPCHTYTPPFDSDPGKTLNMNMILNMTDWDPLLQIYLHDSNSFFYTENSGKHEQTVYLDAETLRKLPSTHPRVICKQINLYSLILYQ